MSNYKTTNNKFFNCPPRMDDARHFTDYRPNCHVNNLLRTNNAIMNSHEYRMFLTHNAEKLMEIHNKHNYAKNGVFNCKEPYETGTMLPEIDRVLCNNDNCSLIKVDENGLGRGRQYSQDPNAILDPFKSPQYKLDDKYIYDNRL